MKAKMRPYDNGLGSAGVNFSSPPDSPDALLHTPPEPTRRRRQWRQQGAPYISRKAIGGTIQSAVRMAGSGGTPLVADVGGNANNGWLNFFSLASQLFRMLPRPQGGYAKIYEGFVEVD